MTAVFLAILDNKLPGKIASIVPPAAAAAGLPESSLPALFGAIANGTAAALASVPGMTDSISAVVARAIVDANVASYAYVYYSVLAIGGVAIIAACSMRDYDDRLTQHVPKQMYHGNRDVPKAVAKYSDEKIEGEAA
jgi:hypothetical protein